MPAIGLRIYNITYKFHTISLKIHYLPIVIIFTLHCLYPQLPIPIPIIPPAHISCFFQSTLRHFLIITNIIIKIILFIPGISHSIYFSPGLGMKNICPTCLINELISIGWGLIYSINSEVVQSLSHVLLFVMPWTVAGQASLDFTISWSFLKPMSFELVIPFNYQILYHPLFLPPSIFPSIRISPASQLFTSGSQNIGVSASASVLPRNIQG